MVNKDVYIYIAAKHRMSAEPEVVRVCIYQLAEIMFEKNELLIPLASPAMGHWGT